jgi:hypothetical protein
MTTYHNENLLDHAAMLAMRAVLAVQPKLEFGPEARPDFGESIEARAKSDPMLTRAALNKAAQLYLGNEYRRDPKASPLYGTSPGFRP